MSAPVPHTETMDWKNKLWISLLSTGIFAAVAAPGTFRLVNAAIGGKPNWVATPVAGSPCMATPKVGGWLLHTVVFFIIVFLVMSPWKTKTCVCAGANSCEIVNWTQKLRYSLLGLLLFMVFTIPSMFVKNTSWWVWLGETGVFFTVLYLIMQPWKKKTCVCWEGKHNCAMLTANRLTQTECGTQARALANPAYRARMIKKYGSVDRIPSWDTSL